MEYANDLGGGALLPADAKLRARVRSLVAWQHSGLSNLCARLSFESSFYPDRRAMLKEEIPQSERVFRMWKDELTHHGGPYLVGGLSLADLAFVPTILRLTSHTAGLAAWPAAQAWTATLLARDTVQEWLRDAYALPPVRLDDYRP